MIRIAIVGTGGMGTVHYNNYAHIDGCKVAALVGITEQSKACAAEWGLPLYADIQSMARAEGVDVVDVCSPTFLHKDHVMEALSLGMHAITEKPVALHKKDAEAMFDLAGKQGKLLLVAQVLQFTREIETLRGLVQSGEYGKPLDAFFERLSACPRWVQNGWLFDRSKSGLLPFDLHIHDLDVIVSLFGRPEHYSFTSCGGAGKTYQEHYRFLYAYKDLNVAAEAAWFNADFPFTARWRVYFENAVVVNDGARLVAYPLDHEPRVFDTTDEIQIPTGINLPPTGMFYRELAHFMDCVKRGAPSERVGREQILTVVGLLEEMAG
ncbi:predicted dehydrogenase [Longilinea arvoryzae]|uniref:Predicted dehydrogenase n=1 Tax=Longilinea arvoryzae TaxID=360412 RepID=A0A0S7BD05_9CHLR|nr:Gfo/Idh/MocA family oxidoreductase [Longilinea arvoryzae]GAP12672.1 predicted dehydrogenase [Longilinea arvoryzae]